MVLESTALFPVKYILGLICSSIFPAIKALFSIWLIHPDYRGSLFLYDIVFPHVQKYFELVNKSAGKIISLVGIPVRDEAADK